MIESLVQSSLWHYERSTLSATFSYIEISSSYSFAQMKLSHNLSIDDERAVEQFTQSVIENSVETFRAMHELQNQVRQHDVIISFSFIVFSSSAYIELNSQSLMMIAQIVAQTLNNQSSFVVHLSANSVVAFIASRFKKLLDISEYERNKNRLNAWKQSLIQRMNMNDDHYFSHRVKIVYVESRLIIDKKTHNLMSQYRVNDLCIIFIFADWWHKLRHCCNNFFKTEDAHLYLREILKQDMNSFADYYNLFYQKKECSLMKNFSLIDCLKRNVNYFTQVIVFFWRNLDEIRSFIFHQWVQAFFDIDEELQQLKHCQSHFIFVIVLFIKVKSISASTSNSWDSKIIISVTVVLTVSSSLSFSLLDESMNLSFVIVIVQDKTLIVSEIKKICNKWKLCYYCKLQHLSKIAKECSNKKFFTLRIMNVYDSDVVSINEEVSLSAKKV